MEPNPHPLPLIMALIFAQRRAGAEQNKGRASYIIHGLCRIDSAVAVSLAA